MKKDCRHLQLVPTVEEHKTRMEKNQKSYAAPAMSSESRARVNQMRGCFEAEIILPDGKFQYFKPDTLNEKGTSFKKSLYTLKAYRKQKKAT